MSKHVSNYNDWERKLHQLILVHIAIQSGYHAGDNTLGDVDRAGEDIKNLFRTTLTQRDQDSTEAERDRIASLCYQLDTDGEKMYQLIYKEV